MTLRIDHHVYLHYEDPRIGEILEIVRNIQKEDSIIMATQQELTDELTALSASVADLTTVEASAEHLLEELSQMLKDALANPDTSAAIAQVKGIADQIGTMRTSLAADVAKNTPAAGSGRI